MKRLATVLAALAVLTPRWAAAQDWGVSWLPVLVPSANEFPFIALGLDYSKMAPYEAPYPSDGAFVAGAGATFKGSWFINTRFRAPGLIPKWRFDVHARAIQQNRFGYYGIGNATTFDPAVAGASPDFYRVRWNQYSGQVEVSREIIGPLRASLAGRWQRTEFRPLSAASQFALDAQGQTVVNDDASARLSVMVDTRDTEYNTQRGVFLEVGAKAGTGGDGYTWVYGSLSGFLSPREGTVIGVRLAGAAAGGTPPLSQRFEFNTWERDRLSYGGRFTNRGFPDPRFGGESVAMGNVDLRHDLLNLGDLGAITLMLFGDAGRVYEMEAFTLSDLHWGAGGGFALRVLRSNVWTFNFSGGSEGFRFLFGSGWMF
jgi:outer membrane protein assembly factor BamA